MGVEPNNNVYMYEEFPPLILIGGPYLYGRERGWAWSHISRHEENMEKKSAKNCTLYHVVKKAVWADIGAASTSSTNILVLHVLAAPIGEDTQTFYNLKNFADFLNVCSANILVLTGLQHQYIGAVQGEPNCLQNHAYLVKQCLFNLLE